MAHHSEDTASPRARQHAVWDDPDGAAEIQAFLRRNPPFLAGFLREHPEMLTDLMPPPAQRGEGVVDLQAVMVARLRDEVDRLSERLDSLLSVSRANMTAQALMHEAVLALLAADSFDAFMDVVTDQLAVMLAIDTASLCVETDEDPAPSPSRAGVFVLPAGGVDALLGVGQDILLESEIRGSTALYGALAPQVRSQALVRLGVGGGLPPCLLALGAREPLQFEEGQATELLEFLARTLEASLRRHLGQSEGIL